MTKTSEIIRLRKMAFAWAKKADEAGLDNEPWSLKNLRYAQNMEAKAHKIYADACRSSNIEIEYYSPA